MAVDLGSTTTRIYTRNTEGQVIAGDLQGKVSTYKVGHVGTVAAFGQLTGDARFEWAAFEGKNLTVGTLDKLLFKTQYPEHPQIVFFTQNKIATVDHGRRVWMLDNKGNMLPGFPHGVNTKFEFAQINLLNLQCV